MSSSLDVQKPLAYDPLSLLPPDMIFLGSKHLAYGSWETQILSKGVLLYWGLSILELSFWYHQTKQKESDQ